MRSIPTLEPADVYNQALLEHVHPAEYQNPKPADRYNLVVLGAGSAGLISAAVAAGLGARVALVERNLMGGDCLNVGCVPSKTLIRSARAVADVRSAGRYGVRVGAEPQVDFEAVMERVRRVRAEIAPVDSVERYTKELGVDVFLGRGQFSGPDRVKVEGQTLRFSRAVVATGARAVAPPIPGLEEAGFLTNETVFSLTRCPERLGVIGAGPIGCELAQAFQRLGAQVTLIEVLPQIMAREDRDAAALVEQALHSDGIELVLGAQIESVERSGAARALLLAGGRRIEVDQLLVGAGRRPNVQDLGLERAGVGFDPVRGVEVDDHLRTDNRRVYAAGDVCLAAQFTHMADASAKIVVQNALFFGRRRVSKLIVPRCTYTDPEVASVGLSEAEAEQRGVGVDVYRVPLADNDRARAEGDEEGFLKVLTRRGGDAILGATLVTRHAGEAISELTLAMSAGRGLGSLVNLIHPYPTQSELVKAAGGQYSRTRLTPFVASLFRRFLALRR